MVIKRRSFNVITDPWIRAIDKQGTVKSYGLRDLFRHLHELDGVVDTSPIVECAMLDFLGVFLMDIYKFRDVYALKNLLECGSIDMDKFDAYVSECEKNGSRFDLYDPEHPFYQCRHDETDASAALKPAASIFIDVPSGNNSLWFTPGHKNENEHEFTDAECIRRLLTIPYFAHANGIGGGQASVIHPNSVHTFILGNNLFETVIYNCVSASSVPNIGYDEPGPVWRRDDIQWPDDVHKNSYRITSLLEGMTLPARNVHLVPDDDGMVRKVYLSFAFRFSKNTNWRDIHCTIAESNKDKNSIRFTQASSGRNIWRNAEVILFTDDKMPVTIRQFERFFQRPGEIMRTRSYYLSCSRTTQPTYLSWDFTDINIPGDISADPEKKKLFVSEIAHVNKVSKILIVHIGRVFSLIGEKKAKGGYQKAVDFCADVLDKFFDEAQSFYYGEFILNLYKLNMENEDDVQKLVQKAHDFISKAARNAYDPFLRRALSAGSEAYVNYFVQYDSLIRALYFELGNPDQTKKNKGKEEK